MMVTMFAHEDDPLKVVGAAVNGHSPSVCLSLIDGKGSDLTLHLDSPGELVKFGEQIVWEGMQLMRLLTLAEAVADPQMFVAGMTETSETHSELPNHLKPKRKACWDQFEAGEVPAHQGTELYLEYARWRLAGGQVMLKTKGE